MLGDWSEADALEEALLGAGRSFVDLPDLRVVDRPGWLQIVTPSFRDGAFNGVSITQLEDAEADEVIDRTIAEYRELGLRFRWAVPPGSRPFDLGERLARRGLTHSWVRAMARSTTQRDAPVAEGVEVEEVQRERIEDYTRVMAEGWNTDPAPLRVAHEAILRAGARKHRLYLASYRGEPAAVASGASFPRSVYLIGAVVLPRFRRRGLYQALVSARLRDAREAGLGLATAQALDTTSAPLLERMGFATVARYQVYRG